MNQFDNYLREQVEPDLYPTTLKEFKKAIRNSPKDYNNMKRLLDVHKSPSTLFKDFQSVPLVDNSIDDKKVKDGVEYYSA